MDIKEWLITWFEEKSDVVRSELDTSANYLEKSWIDSLKFVEFISAIEAQFDLTFSNDEFHDRSFSTIDGLARIIQRKIDAQG
jgi:acyl carrier protein